VYVEFCGRHLDSDKNLAPIRAVTPQQEVGELEGLGVGERWCEEYERIAGNSYKKIGNE